MTPLRQQMIDAMRQRGYSERTHESYVAAVRDLARYYHRSPAQLSIEELQGYFKYLALERELSAASCRLYFNAVRFLYLRVLQRPAFNVPLVLPKQVERIPELLTRAEVARIFAACANPKHRMVLETCYGCGLRVSEVVALRVRHIDGERALLRVEQGKGAKDRAVMLSPGLLDRLRRYWQLCRPREWLFPNTQQPQRPIGISTAQRVFTQAKRRSGVEKVGGIHSLRHAYATHQLENGLAVHQLQRLLGHSNLRSTLRYLHWVPGAQGGGQGPADLIGQLERHHG